MQVTSVLYFNKHIVTCNRVKIMADTDTSKTNYVKRWQISSNKLVFNNSIFFGQRDINRIKFVENSDSAAIRVFIRSVLQQGASACQATLIRDD